MSAAPSRTGRLTHEGAHVRDDALDVHALPTYGYSHHSLMWWGTLGIMAIEGTAFFLLVTIYFYLRVQHSTWPLAGAPPELLWGTLNSVVMLASALPNHWTKKAAGQEDLRKVRIGIGLCLAFAVVFLVLRVFEFRSLNVRWDDNAYGSAVWMLLGAHTVHLVTDVADTLVLWVLAFTKRFTRRRFVDVSENAMYWYFVVFAWIPIYAVIYLASRY